MHTEYNPQNQKLQAKTLSGVVRHRGSAAPEDEAGINRVISSYDLATSSIDTDLQDAMQVNTIQSLPACMHLG